jgi:hypothetical protein
LEDDDDQMDGLTDGMVEMLAQQQRHSYLFYASLYSSYLKSIHIHLMYLQYERYSLSDAGDMTIEQ